jgi:hypothetical protein
MEQKPYQFLNNDSEFRVERYYWSPRLKELGDRILTATTK